MSWALTKFADRADHVLQSFKLKVLMEGLSSEARADVAACTKVLCNDYVEDRLIRSGLNLKQRKITRVLEPIVEDRSLKASQTKPIKPQVKRAEAQRQPESDNERKKKIMSDVSKVLLYVGEMLELRHTSVYTDVLTQLNIRTLTEISLKKAVASVGNDLFVHGISWAKIISFFAFAGGISVDCVLTGSTFFVPKVKQFVVEFIDENLTEWIIRRGGWIGFFHHFTVGHHHDQTRLIWTVAIATVLASFLIMTIASMLY